MSGATRIDSFEPDADGLSSPQDSGYFGAPFTASNNSLGAVGGGLQEEYGSMNADMRNAAAISGTWNIDYFHGDNNVVKDSAQWLDDLADSHSAQRRSVLGNHRGQQEL